MTPTAADTDDDGDGAGAGVAGDGGASSGSKSGMEFEVSLPVFGMGARQFMAPALSAEDRQKEFIAAMKRDKEAAEVSGGP